MARLLADLPQLALAVVAAEDQHFPEHNGFDFKQIQKAMDDAAARRPLARRQHHHAAGGQEPVPVEWPQLCAQGARGLVHGADRKLWPKQRILEVYLNIAEFGRGIYGAEAAAQAFLPEARRAPHARRSRTPGGGAAQSDAYACGAPAATCSDGSAQIEAQMAALGGTAYLAPLKR